MDSIKIYEQDPSVVAAALKQHNLEMLAKIHPDELIKYDWDKHPGKSPNVLALASEPQKIANGALNDILLAGNQVDQQKIYNFYVRLSSESLRLGDLHTAQAIILAVNAPSTIGRLNYLQEDENIKQTNAFVFNVFKEKANINKAILVLQNPELGVADSIVRPFTGIMNQVVMTKEGMGNFDTDKDPKGADMLNTWKSLLEEKEKEKTGLNSLNQVGSQNPSQNALVEQAKIKETEKNGSVGGSLDKEILGLKDKM